MKYVPALDGLRAVAVLMVICVHSQVPGLRGGFVGVDVFFVLSGYLITRLLAETSPTLGQFYVRRLLRLTPPLILMLAGYLLVFPLFAPDYPHLRDAGIALAYLSDYAMALYSHPNFIGHTWSLAVEEHFYLLWPLIFFRFRPSIRVLVYAYVATTLWRTIGGDWMSVYYRFDARLSGLILGCIIANFPRGKFPAWPGLLVLAYAPFYMAWGTLGTLGPGIMLVELATAVAILGTPPRWLESPRLAYFGKLSYGMYLWHYPIARLLRDDYPWWVTLPACLLGSYAFAAISYHTVEAWIRRHRSVVRERSSRRGEVNGIPGHAIRQSEVVNPSVE